MDLNQAIAKHADWKLEFRNAMAKRETMDAQTLSEDRRCELGVWLHGEAKMTLGRLTSYPICLAKHAAFHIEAGKVAYAINAERYEEAEAMLDATSAYSHASVEVGRAIMFLKHEAGL